MAPIIPPAPGNSPGAPESERLYVQHVDGWEWDPVDIITAGLAHVTYDGHMALLAVPVDNGSVLSGVYDDLPRAAADIAALDEERRWSLYARLQPLADRVATTNCLRPGPAINADQIAGLARLLIEVDAQHRDGEPPTAEAIVLAHDVASLVWAVLLRAGVPRPALSALQSGHGVHVIVGCRLGGIAADVQLWRDILASLADALAGHELGGELIDQSVADLTRSTRITATMNVKYADEPAPVWLLRPWGGGSASLDVLQQLARRGRSLREEAVRAQAERRRELGTFSPGYRPAWVRELLSSGAADHSRHLQCRRLAGWFVSYAPTEAEQAIDDFVRASRWDGGEARAILRFYMRRHGRAA